MSTGRFQDIGFQLWHRRQDLALVTSHCRPSLLCKIRRETQHLLSSSFDSLKSCTGFCAKSTGRRGRGLGSTPVLSLAPSGFRVLVFIPHRGFPAISKVPVGTKSPWPCELPGPGNRFHPGRQDRTPKRASLFSELRLPGLLSVITDTLSLPRDP